ncbi:MAG: glycosyltransferase family 39 protein [Ramlibacter sp.]
MRDGMRRAHFLLLCGAVGLFALLLRLPTLSSRSLWLDETYSAWFAGLPLHALWTDVPLYETHPPFYYTLLKGWSGLFGATEAALRSLCVLASVLTVVLIPVCARVARLGARAERIALLAALLLSVNANSIVFAQQARPYAIHALAGMLAVFCSCMLVLALSTPGAHGTPQRRPWPWIAGLALSASLVLWLHNTGIFAAFGIWTGMGAGLLLASPGPRGRQALAVGLAGLGALLLWSPFVPMLLRQSAAMDQLSYWIRFSPGKITSAWTVMSGARVMHYPMMALVLLAFGWLWKRARPHFWLLACTMLLPVLALGAYSLVLKPVFLARLFEWLAPLTMVLAALGIAVLRPAWRPPALAAVLALSAWSVLAFYRADTEDWRGMLARLQHDARPGDLVLAFPNEVQMPVTYYMKQGPAVTYLPAPFPARGLPRRYTGNAGAPDIAPEDIPRLRALLWGRQRVWLIERRADLYDPDGLVMKELARCCRLQRKAAGNGANISLYETAAAQP